MSSDLQNAHYLLLKWNGDKFQVVPQLLSDDVTQVLLLDKNNVGLVYFSLDLTSLDQRNMYRQLDSLKRSNFDRPDGGKFKATNFIEVHSTYTLKNIVRALKTGVDVQAILNAEKSPTEDLLPNVQDNDVVSYKRTGDILYSKELPIFRLTIQFLSHSIRVLDLTDQHILVEKKLPSFCTAIEPIVSRGTRYKLTIDNKSYELTIDLLDIVHGIKTKARYVSQVHLFGPSGYFVGLHEFGTFFIEDDKIIL